MELLKNQHGETHNAVATLADSRWIEEVEVNEKGFREWDEWESDEGTLIRGVTEERNEESLYSQDAMSWGIPRKVDLTPPMWFASRSISISISKHATE